MKCLLNRALEGTTDFSSESWTASNNASSDTSLLIPVIVLAVIILLLLGGAGFAYLRYIRSVF